MYAATRSFERFRQPITWRRRKKSIDNAVPKSTAYKTRSISPWRGDMLQLFEEWKQNRLVKCCTFEPDSLFTTKDFEGVETLDTTITDMSTCSVNCWLSKFVQEESKSSVDAILPVRCTQLFADWSATFVILLVINIHCLKKIVIVHAYFNKVVYTTLTGEWNTVFHWVSKRMHVVWYTSSDW